MNTQQGLRDLPLIDFLVDRLTDDLGSLWEREEHRAHSTDRPGLAAQVAVIDEQLSRLASGNLPCRRELRILLFGYGNHPDFDPGWTNALLRAA